MLKKKKSKHLRNTVTMENNTAAMPQKQTKDF